MPFLLCTTSAMSPVHVMYAAFFGLCQSDRISSADEQSICRT